MLDTKIDRPSAPTSPRPWWVAVVLFLAFLLTAWHAPLMRSADAGARTAEITTTRWSLHAWPVLKSQHFDVYYPRGQKADASLSLKALTAALPLEERNLDQTLREPLVVVVYPTVQAMNRAVGEPADANNIGYEYHGVVDILSPSAWLGTGPNAAHAFLQQGPAAHELGHALLDLKANMNYPAWFNEGVAQYEDYRATGYQWLTPTNSLHGRLYSLSQLTHGFYALPNQSRAYREGLSLVEYLETSKGHAVFVDFLNRLAQGTPFNQALRQSYHLTSQHSLFSAWQQWLNG